MEKPRFKDISRQCGIQNLFLKYGFETTAIVFFLVPITLITVLYVLIGINLRKSSNQIKSESNYAPKELLSQLGEQNHSENVNLYQRHNSVSSSQQKQIASRRSVVRMLGLYLPQMTVDVLYHLQTIVCFFSVAVVIAFFFCYSTFHAQRVLAANMDRFRDSKTIKYLYDILLHISGVTYYLSATINPILYQVMSQKFRIAFKDTFGHCLPCLRNDLPEITYATIIGGVSSYKLSRTGSFYSNGSYRRSSMNLDVASPLPNKRVSLADVINSQQDTKNYSGPPTPATAAAAHQPDRIRSPPIHDPQRNQFLNVPTIKF